VTCKPKTRAERNALEVMTLEDFRKLHPTATPEVLEALYDDRLVAFDEDIVDAVTPQCPLCGGHQQILGNLGDRVHFRCRACGTDTSQN
jgi:tRNA(Ile2) C34 agmatinyltransferase TiaS